MKGVGTSGADRGQVGAGAEGAAFAPQHGDRGGRVRVELAERVGERPRGGAVDGVPYVGAVQDDRGHRTVAFDAYRHGITVRVPSVEYGVAGRGAERLASGEEPAQPLGLPSDLRYGGGLPQAAATQRAERPAVECGAAGDVDQGTGHVDVEPEPELVSAGKSGIDQRRDEAVVRRASGAGAVDHGAVPAGDGAGVEADGGLEARCERRQAAALDDERTLVAKLLDGGGDRRRHPVPVHFPVPGRVSQEPFPVPRFEATPDRVRVRQDRIHDGTPVARLPHLPTYRPEQPAERTVASCPVGGARPSEPRPGVARTRAVTRLVAVLAGGRPERRGGPVPGG